MLTTLPIFYTSYPTQAACITEYFFVAATQYAIRYTQYAARCAAFEALFSLLKDLLDYARHGFMPEYPEIRFFALTLTKTPCIMDL